jgi:hypothetical protein
MAWTRRFKFVKIAILPKAIYRFNVILTKVLRTSLQNGNPKIHKEFQVPRIAKIILKKKKNVGRLILSNFKTNYKATLIKTV